jgi:hypothetical protein
MNQGVHYLTFDEVGITVAVIAVALAFIVLVWNAVKAIHDWRQLARKPDDDKFADHEARIKHLEQCCTEATDKLQCDWEFQQDEKEFNRLMLSSIKQLLKHSLDGNDKDGLKKMEQEIDNYLLDHAQ